MKRIQEKVKDLIEVRSYRSLLDFNSNPEQTVAIYHFTDITSELMAKCLDKIAAVRPENGAAAALAGYRGVGKSHFLAALGAVVAHSELRSKIKHAHVAASLQRLKRARYTVASVRRGTHETLFEELKAGIAKAFGTSPANLSDQLDELLTQAAKSAGDTPFVLIIDTAFERTARVKRDDGVLLGRIAEIAKTAGIFVAVALDDDIADADGINAAIARNFTIDYLDTEHLYRIVDTNIFPKHRQMSPLLHEIYLNFKESMPDFRWSEQRFTSLYPLHPVILETAPFVRLYAPEFALLSFTSEAGDKIQGRPANSLIALDEVFDSVEASLRRVEDLREAFVTYDRISQQVITQIPVMQRLQAKLILKGLFLLSLEGNGVTAGEIGAAMLIYDENDPPKAVRTVEDLLETYVRFSPNEVLRARGDEEGGATRYKLKVSSQANVSSALNEAAKNVSNEVAPTILRRIASERFSDWLPPSETATETVEPDAVDCETIWRGSRRRGRLIWNGENSGATYAFGTNAATDGEKFYDWEVVIDAFGSGAGEASDKESAASVAADSESRRKVSRFFWRLAPLRADEIQTILRYHVLISDTALRDEFGEQLSAVGHAVVVAVEKVWHRIFLEEATFEIEGFDYNFTETARTARSLADLFSEMLAPLYEAKFAEHPYFSETLGMAEASQIASDFFSGARQDLPESQRLAEIFAAPLNLVARRGSQFFIETEENLINLPLAQKVLSLIKESPEKAVSLDAVYAALSESPFGLTEEAQNLILTALVAQRRIEFVTTQGDRINRRSLDLKIIWDDIEGVAKPSGVLYADQRLNEWANILIGSGDFRSIETPKDRHAVKSALDGWLSEWETKRVLERFNELPDEIFNTRIWRTATHAEKTFGAVAATVKAISDDTITLEQGLHRIADAFSDSEREFMMRRRDLKIVESFTDSAAVRQEIWNYLAICETTDDAPIERRREKLINLLDDGYANPNQNLNDELVLLWNEQRAAFADYYAARHDSVMKSGDLPNRFKKIFESVEWWDFAALSALPIFQKTYWTAAQRIERRSKDLNCRFETREMLEKQPFCACSFSLARSPEWENLPFALEEIAARGRLSYRRILQTLGQTIVDAAESFAAETTDEEFFKSAVNLIAVFKNAKSAAEIPLFSAPELVLLQKIFETLPSSPLVTVAAPSDESFVSADKLRYQVNEWLDNLPNEPVLLKF